MFVVTLASEDGDPVPCSGIAGPADPKLSEKYGGCYATSDATGKIAFRYGVPTQADRALKKGGAFVMLLPLVDGFWTARHQQVKNGAALVADGLPSSEWWKDLMNPTGISPDLGKGIRVGIIDSPWESDAGLEHVTRTDCNGDESPLEQLTDGCWAHGEMVTRLVAQRSGGSMGMAPRSDYHFVAISEQSDGHLDPGEVIDAIAFVAARGADLINLSFGCAELDARTINSLRVAVQDAESQGSLCIVASGNDRGDGQQVYAPARFKECIGVGAIGCRDTAPPATLSGCVESEATMWGSNTPGGPKGVDCSDIFLSPRCAIGRGLDVVAPGLAVFAHRNGKPSHELYGTSFAAPLVAGVLASLLGRDDSYRSMARDRRRAEHARAVLKRACYGLGLRPEYQGDGLPMVT